MLAGLLNRPVGDSSVVHEQPEPVKYGDLIDFCTVHIRLDRVTVEIILAWIEKVGGVDDARVGGEEIDSAIGPRECFFEHCSL